MSRLKELAERVVSVPMGDEVVKFRLPRHPERQAVIQRVMQLQDVAEADDPAQAAKVTAEHQSAVVDALLATVVEPNDLTREDWERIIVASNEPELAAEYEGITEVVEQAMKLCGLRTIRELSEAVVETATDHIGEVDAEIGDVPT